MKMNCSSFGNIIKLINMTMRVFLVQNLLNAVVVCCVPNQYSHTRVVNGRNKYSMKQICVEWFQQPKNDYLIKAKMMPTEQITMDTYIRTLTHNRKYNNIIHCNEQCTATVL